MVHQECFSCENNDVAHKTTKNGFKNKDIVVGVESSVVQHILQLTG